MSRVMLTEAPKPSKKVAKKKKGSGQKPAPQNSNAIAHSTSNVVQSSISFGEVKAVMAETVWRVQHEIQPEMSDSDVARLNSDETAYVLALTMLYGAGVDGMAKGLKIREKAIGDPPDCGKHDD